MKKYLVLRTNHGFQGRMWHQDSTVEFEDDVKPPHHFHLLDGKPESKKAVENRQEELQALSLVAQKSIKPQPTAGAVMRKQKKAGEEF